MHRTDVLVQPTLKSRKAIAVHHVVWQVIPFSNHSVTEEIFSNIQSAVCFLKFKIMTPNSITLIQAKEVAHIYIIQATKHL